MKWLLRIKVSEGANEKLRQWSTLYTWALIHYLANFSRKLHENEEIFNQRGAEG